MGGGRTGGRDGGRRDQGGNGGGRVVNTSCLTSIQLTSLKAFKQDGGRKKEKGQGRNRTGTRSKVLTSSDPDTKVFIRSDQFK